MVNMNIQMKKRDGNSWDNLFPITTSDNVFDEDGVSVTEQMEQVKQAFNDSVSMVTTDSEVILARGGHTTLNNRLDFVENEYSVDEFTKVQDIMGVRNLMAYPNESFVKSKTNAHYPPDDVEINKLIKVKANTTYTITIKWDHISGNVGHHMFVGRGGSNGLLATGSGNTVILNGNGGMYTYKTPSNLGSNVYLCFRFLNDINAQSASARYYDFAVYEGDYTDFQYIKSPEMYDAIKNVDYYNYIKLMLDYRKKTMLDFVGDHYSVDEFAKLQDNIGIRNLMSYPNESFVKTKANYQYLDDAEINKLIKLEPNTTYTITVKWDHISGDAGHHLFVGRGNNGLFRTGTGNLAILNGNGGMYTYKTPADLGTNNYLCFRFLNSSSPQDSSAEYYDFAVYKGDYTDFQYTKSPEMYDAITNDDYYKYIKLILDYRKEANVTNVKKYVDDKLDAVNDGVPLPFSHDAEIVMFTAYGQSWALGYDQTAYSTEQIYDNVMFDIGISNEPLEDEQVPTSLVPLIEEDGTHYWSDLGQTQTIGETPVAGQTNMVKQLLLEENNATTSNIDYQLLGNSPGVGSASIDDLSKGTKWYNRLITQVQQAYDLAQSKGKTFKMLAFSWTQASGGEKLEILRSDIETDVKAITGQSEPVVCITWQNFPTTSTQAKSRYDNFVKISDTYEHIYTAGPSYQLKNLSKENLHFEKASTIELGALYGRVFKRVINDELDWQPLRPVKITTQGKIALVEFNASAPLTFDTTKLTLADNFGFKVKNDSGTDQILNSVEIVSPTTVKIVKSTNFTDTDRIVYGSTGTGWGGTDGNRGNLRDSSNDVYEYKNLNIPLHNWCVVFDLSVTELNAVEA